MPTISFPSSPSLNDTYTFGDKTWVWNGKAWQLQISGAINNIVIGNVTPRSGAFTTLDATGNITTPANISGGYLLGNGAFLTGLPVPYGNANVKSYLESGATINANFGGGNITSTGTATFGATQVNGNLNVAGNIVATGNVTYISVQDLVISDPLIYLGADNPADLQDLGVVGSFNDGTYQHTGFVRDHTDDTWKVFTGVTAEPNTVVDWTQAVYAPFKSGAITSNASILANTTITAVGNISGGNVNSNGSISGASGSFGALAVTGNSVLGDINSNLRPAANITYDLGSSNQRWKDIWLANSTIHLGNAQVSANITSLILTNPLGGQMVLSGAESGITATGNITGDYFLGNGRYLTGLPAGYSNSDVANYLASDSSIVITTTANITSSANISGGYILGNGAFLTGIVAGSNYGNANVADYLASDAAVTILTTANITTAANISGSYILGNGAFLTGLPASYSNANVKTYLESGNTINANFGGGNISTTGTATFGPTQIYGNLDVAGNIIATGNITYTGINDLVVDNPLIYLGANNTADLFDLGIVGTFVDGTSQYTGIVRDYIDDTWKVFTGVTNEPNTVIDWNQAVYAPFKAGDITANANITANGNVSGSYILGNGAFLTGIVAGSNYSNANVANYLANNESITIATTGNITTGANISGSYILGNGAFLTGIVAGSNYSNANVANYLANNESITIATTGNITTGANIAGDYILGNGAFLTGIVAGSNYSNSNVADYLAGNSAVTILTTSNITTAANIAGDYILGNGAFLTGIVAGSNYSNANVANYLANNESIIIVTTGNITTTANISGSYILGNGAFLTGLPAPYGNANVKVYLESGNTINANFGGGNITTMGTATFGPATVNGNLSVSGNIIATGNITYIKVQDLVIEDPMIYLAADNPADLNDLGVVGSFNDGTYQHTGFVRDHTDDTWKVFTGVTTEPNNVVNWSQAIFAPFKSGAITSNASIQANTTITAVGNISGGNIGTAGQVTATGNITGGNINTANAVNGYSLNITDGANVGNLWATGNVVGGNVVSNAAIISVTANVTANAVVGNLSTAGQVFANGNITTESYFIGNGAFITSLTPRWAVASANYSAVKGQGIFANTAGNAFTVTLPASPTLGDTIYFCDSDGTWAINNLTINRNGGLIMGLSEDLVCDESNTSFSLVFNGTSWRIV